MQSEFESFRAMAARFGFINCELTEIDFWKLRESGLDFDSCYSVECDLQAGFSIAESLAAMERAE